MKFSIVTVTTIILIASFVGSGCDSQSNKTEKAEPSVIEANQDLEIGKSEVEAELRIYRTEKASRKRISFLLSVSSLPHTNLNQII